jgi:tetratricopeptide (TPR) repeat protein
MKRNGFFILFLLSLILSTSSKVFAQRGERNFERGMSLFEKGQFYKAGKKFINAYNKGYFPAFESLTFASLAFNIEEYNSTARMCLESAEQEALYFVSDYKRSYENISPDRDTALFKDNDSMYEALFIIADTAEFWREYGLKDDIDLLLYTAATIYCDESVNDTAIYYANLGLKYKKDPDLYIIKGDCWLVEEQPDSALAAFSIACELAPEDLMAFTGMGEAFEQKEQYGKAMNYYNMALDMDSTSTWALYCKAYLSELQYDYERAIELYSKIIELNPAYYISYFKRAGVYFNLDDYEAAIEDYKKYLEFEPGDEDALYNIDAAEENMWEGY